jgi:hypothetical protein
LRLVENAELSQHRPAVVVDFFSSETVLGIERVHTAKWELDSSPRRRKTPPPAEVRTANHNFNHDCVVCDVSALYFDFEVRQRLHELLIKPADPAPALEVFAPRRVVVACSIAEGAKNAFEVMLILKSNVLLDQCDTSRHFVLRN